MEEVIVLKKKSTLKKDSTAYTIFRVFNGVFLLLTALTCIFPLVHILAVSLSGKGPTEANIVTLIPQQFTWDSYGYVFETPQFWQSFKITILKTVLGTGLSLVLTICLAYPLSRENDQFRGKKIYMFLVIFAMLFNGGLVPTYLLVANTLQLKDTIWALVLPCSIQIFSAIMMMNFIRMLPKELEEAAFIDGADHFNTLKSIILPCSTPIIATVIMFAFISQWNSWFDGLIYNSQPEGYPLQTYLQQFLKEPPTSNVGSVFTDISERSLACSNIFIIMIPILIFYPWMQKYFIKGITLGSVKG